MAEDITQEVFMYLLKNKYNDEYSFKYYIYLVAKSRAISYIKKENNRLKINEKYLELDDNNILEDVYELIVKDESKQELLECINELPNKYKNVIYLTQIEELSYIETANILEENVSNIKTKVHRGKKELKKILIKKGYIDDKNKVLNTLILIICISFITLGSVYAGVVVYENIKSYYMEETVTEPVSNSEAPVGEIVYKSFNVLKNEKDIDFQNWEEDEKNGLLYKRINKFSEYEDLMKNYSNIRPLSENDFNNYFAVVILSKDISNSLKYRFITYSDSDEEDPIMNINLYKEENNDSNENKDSVKYRGLVVIMTLKHIDYNIIPKLK